MITQGQQLPDISMPVIRAGKMTTESIRALTSGRRTVVFAMPGAFTPTCSQEHLPGYVEAASKLADRGVEEIFCLTVNDGFVVTRFAESASGSDSITFLADGNCEFTRAVGMTLDASAFHLGERSQRYAMIVDDSKVSVIHVEDGVGHDVSSAESILRSL